MNRKPWLAAQEEPEEDEEILSPSETTIRWFGPQRPFRHSVRTRVEPPPPGETCMICHKPFTDADQGLRIPFLSNDATDGPMADYHHECFLVSILGPNILNEIRDDSNVRVTLHDEGN